MKRRQTLLIIIFLPLSSALQAELSISTIKMMQQYAYRVDITQPMSEEFKEFKNVVQAERDTNEALCQYFPGMWQLATVHKNRKISCEQHLCKKPFGYTQNGGEIFYRPEPGHKTYLYHINQKKVCRRLSGVNLGTGQACKSNNYLAFIHQDTLRIYDINNNRYIEMAPKSTPRTKENHLTCLAVSPKNDTLVIANKAHLIAYLFSQNHDTIKPKYYVNSYGNITAMDFSSNGNYIALGTARGNIFIVDTEKFIELQTIKTHLVGILTLKFSPCNTKLCCSGIGGTTSLLKIPEAKRSAHPRAKRIAGLTKLSPDGFVLFNLLRMSRTMTMYTSHDIKKFHTMTVREPIVEAAISPRGDTYAVLMTNGMIELYEPTYTNTIKELSLSQIIVLLKILSGVQIKSLDPEWNSVYQSISLEILNEGQLDALIRQQTIGKRPSCCIS